MAFLCARYGIQAASFHLQDPAGPGLSLSTVLMSLLQPHHPPAFSCLSHRHTASVSASGPCGGQSSADIVCPPCLPWGSCFLSFKPQDKYPAEALSKAATQSLPVTRGRGRGGDSVGGAHTRRWDYPVCLFFCLFFDLPWNIPQEGSDFLVSVLIIAVLSASAVSP